MDGGRPSHQDTTCPLPLAKALGAVQAEAAHEGARRAADKTKKQSQDGREHRQQRGRRLRGVDRVRERDSTTGTSCPRSIRDQRRRTARHDGQCAQQRPRRADRARLRADRSRWQQPVGLKTDAYKLLAEGLAEERIASVRVDKRGMFGSAGAGDPNTATPAAYVADYPCLDRRHQGRARLEMRLPARPFRRRADGLSGSAGPQGCLRPHPRRRHRAQDGRCHPRAAARQPRQRAGARRTRCARSTSWRPAAMSTPRTCTPPCCRCLRPQVQDYLISDVGIDPVEAVRRAGKKTLVVQGTTDLQVTVDDATCSTAAPKNAAAAHQGDEPRPQESARRPRRQPRDLFRSRPSRSRQNWSRRSRTSLRTMTRNENRRA